MELKRNNGKEQENNGISVKTEKQSSQENENDDDNLNQHPQERSYDDSNYYDQQDDEEEPESFDEENQTSDRQQQQNDVDDDNIMGDTNNKKLYPPDNKLILKVPSNINSNYNMQSEPSNLTTPDRDDGYNNNLHHADDNMGENHSEDKSTNNLDDDDPMEDEIDDGELQNNNNNIEPPSNQQPNIWTLPADKNVCTLEEIRRGQVINKIPPTMCPVIGCGKIINENKAEPSPGTIASGLRTHVLFVHYATQHGRKVVKKRKTLGWTNKKRNQSPRKQLNQLLSSRFSNLDHQQSSSGAATSLALSCIDDYRNDPLDLKQHSSLDMMANLQKNMAEALKPIINSNPGSLLDKKVKQMAANKSLQVLQMSSHQSLMQATGGNVASNSLSSSNGSKQNSSLVQRPKNLTTSNNSLIPKQTNTITTTTSNNNGNNYNSTASSLYSILAGFTAQQQKNPQQQPPLPRNIKTAHGTNTINISQCSRNPTMNNGNTNTNNRATNSSLLSLLNEKISGDVASSLQNQLKKSLAEQRFKTNSSTPNRISTSPALTSNSSFYHPSNNEPSPANGASLLSNLCSTGVSANDDNGSFDTSMPLNTFVDMIAIRTGSNIGQAGVAEVKKFIEKFTTSLICSSQTIATHYLAPYGGDVPQQKPEISPSDVILAYKMMNKSVGQL